MADYETLHKWDVSPQEAAAIQRRLRPMIQTTNGFDPAAVTRIAGIDVSLKDEGEAAVVVLSFPDLALLDHAIAVRKLTFPYVPGYLSFREAPVVLAAFDKLKVKPDVLMVDGQGIAHPRRLGIAAHLGLVLDMPAIGCAKSVLAGKHAEVGLQPGDRQPLMDKGEIIGMALRTKLRSNPLIISIGHKIDLETATDFVLRCVRGYRLPEPTRAAHNFAGSAAQTAMHFDTPGALPEQGTLF